MFYSNLNNNLSSFDNSSNLYSFSEQDQNIEGINYNSFPPFLNDKLDFNQDNQEPDYLLPIINTKSVNLEKQNTKWATLGNDNIFRNDESNLNCVFLEKIKQNLPKFAEFPVERLINNKNIKDIEIKLCRGERKRDIVCKNKKKENNNELCIIIKKEKEAGEKIKRGRKIEKENKYRKEHNKYSENNIIIKIKSKLLLYALQFLNKLLKNNNNRKNTYKLYKLDYKYSQRLKKEEDLKILDMSLKDIFSFDISSKYKHKSYKFNKNTIKKIIKHKELKNYQAIMFAFNLKFREWIDLFTYQKTVNQLINNDDKRNETFINEIEKNIVYAVELLKDILEGNDEDYLSRFTLLLYNYERWFEIKKERRI